MISRRAFLATASALPLLPRAAIAAPTQLRAGPIQAQILPQGEGQTRMLGFNGMTPGPLLRVRQGSHLSAQLVNAMDQMSAIHWHGIHIDNAMDGVPGLTQEPVQPGDSFVYDFLCPHAGTYWYHAHHRSWEQVAKGLYGPLIVEELAPPDVDHDLPVIIDDFRFDENGALAGGFGNMHDFAHAGRLGNFARIFAPTSQIMAGQRVRLRLINTATARSFFVYLNGIDGRVVAIDGMPLKAPTEINDILLAPAQRMDVIADVLGPIDVSMWTQNGPFDLGSIAVSGEVAKRSAPIAALPPNDIASPGPEVQTLRLRMQGGAMGHAHGGEDIWAFNDVSGMTQQPFAKVRRGDTVRISLANETAFAHGIHVHGHHFFLVGPDDALQGYRDTVLVEPNQTQDILCVFDNPGKWLIHCHMLGHQAAGMKTWVEVA